MWKKCYNFLKFQLKFEIFGSEVQIFSIDDEFDVTLGIFADNFGDLSEEI